ncbi:MAG: preprotein translocase subunit SecE [Elusimicrobiaceae bacterium]|nr:preprotein translocase subunit SecE [Elusimicrobiaceae bacterium]
MTKIINFFKESYGELKKSVWLSKQQMIQSTIFVFIVVGIVTLYIAIIDWGLAGILSRILGGN